MGIRKIDLGVVCIIGVTNPEREGEVCCGNWKEAEMQQGQWDCKLRWYAGCMCVQLSLVLPLASQSSCPLYASTSSA